VLKPEIPKPENKNAEMASYVACNAISKLKEMFATIKSS
jgi:hypothetical protein